MSLFPLADWVGPIPNRTAGGMGHVQGLVLHIEQGTERGTDSWFHNAAAQASAHFGNPKTGRLQQFVDTADKAWAEVAGNSEWISVEHEGNSGDSLTASQLENDAQLLAWLHGQYGVPLVLADSPAADGLGYHAMGGSAWGGHLQCPGAPIVAARAQIIARAKQIFAPTPAPVPTPKPAPVLEDDMASLCQVPGQPAVWACSTSSVVQVPSSAIMGELVSAGLAVLAPNGKPFPISAAVLSWLQKVAK